VDRVIAFVKLGRPLFLGGGFVLYALGATVAAWSGHAIDWRRYALGQGAVTAFQLMTHYANDYFDLEADRANATPTRWSGGSRVLAGGALPPRVALIAALAFAALGTAVGTQLLDAAPTLAAILVFAWCYSAPPLRLCARGLGELDTALVVTGLVPWLAFSLQGGGRTAVLVAALVPLVLLQVAMLLAIELPDAAGDAATGKRTIVVRFGARTAVRIYMALTAVAYLWLPIAWWLGVPALPCACAALPAPLAAWRIARMAGDAADPAGYERLTFAAVALLVATSAAMLIGFMNSTTAASS
jgi:1,4-dihydroxy-2-naphthoate octaprenyltransferase